MSPARRAYNKRRSSEIAVADALISLPTGVLDDILARAGLRDAVRTSALSRAWRRRWEALPSIDLLFLDDGNKGLRAVDGILLRYPGRIRRFDAYLDHDLQNLYSSRVTDWIIALYRRGLEAFNLISVDGYIDLPSAVFSRGSLTMLRLCGCAIPFLPAGFEGFPKLKNLAFLNVRFQVDGEYQLEEIIATSPSLEELTLWDVEIAGDFKEWAIQAPNLRHLSIRTPDDLGWNPGELPSLRSAEIEICDLFGDRDFGKFLTRFANITELTIYTHHPLSNGANILETLPCTFGKLKSLKLYTQFCELSSILLTFCLLRSSPNLERLRRVIDDGADQKYEANGEFQNAQWTDGMCANLQFVQITGIHWLSNELTFIELILSNARLLRTLSVSHGEKCSMSNGDAVNKLLKYTRASSRAEVIYEGKAKKD
ncbi:F-box/FBD/LRR-repeat protein At1g13570-like [Lolium rigidum]|uniref:F-box/FBD/LRR-repeat protein At1g13570-like n=1 Tax=Lolium rigidum TaxID=89674 RepID=UPI001F5D6FC5|nr:F-box/FBD/LRR-repeat protein At1g13570-like [Lolium rigidum]